MYLFSYSQDKKIFLLLYEVRNQRRLKKLLLQISKVKVIKKIVKT